MLERAFSRGALAVLLAAVLVAVPITDSKPALAAAAVKTDNQTRVPMGNIGKFKQRFTEQFNTTAAAKGPFAARYAQSWQPYPDAMSKMYYSGTQISSHHGVMDVYLSGTKGAAGTFGTQKDAWTHVGGKFTIRARATGGDGNGAAVMLWPTSNVWADGEIDYPEGNFEATPMSYHQSMTPGHEASTYTTSTKVDWRSWHTYSIEWIPGKSVTYLLDNRVIRTITRDVPKTAHRYMFQVGNWGKPGHLYIDWVTTYDYVG
jgi:hypothetical protein